MRILVFGASGFVGRHVLDRLAANHEVAGVVRKNDQNSPNLLVADLTIVSQVEAAIAEFKPEVIVNCAGLFAADQNVSLNKVFTGNIFEAAYQAGGVRRIVICSSASVYGVVGQSERATQEDDKLAATADYGVSKIEEEQTARQLGEQYGIQPIMARIFNSIGTGSNPKLLLPNLLRQVQDIKAGNSDTIEVSRLDALRDYVNVEDVAIAFEHLATGRPKFDTYNIGSGQPTSTRQLIETIIDLIDPSLQPKLIEKLDSPEPVSACKADTSRLKEDFGWQPTHSLKETIKEIASA